MTWKPNRQDVFGNLGDLSRLPWFDLHDGRLVVFDPSVGPVIDMHSHIALPYLVLAT